MKQIEFNIKKPYANYFAFKTLKANIERVFDWRMIVKDNDYFFTTNWDIMRRVNQIMHETEYYKRGNNHEKFNANYKWEVLPNEERPETINIKSIFDKEVGTITVKQIEHHDTRCNSI